MSRTNPRLGLNSLKVKCMGRNVGMLALTNNKTVMVQTREKKKS